MHLEPKHRVFPAKADSRSTLAVAHKSSTYNNAQCISAREGSAASPPWRLYSPLCRLPLGYFRPDQGPPGGGLVNGEQPRPHLRDSVVAPP